MSEAAVAGAPERKSRFTLPSAYTILFALIVLAAIATWVIPAGVYNLNAAGEPIPGTYHEVAAKPARILVDSLTAPINGLYGIENANGNINYYNSGSLFGAIDIALFILVIGGFLGVTMKTGAIQAGIGSLVERMRGRERWMIPVLMSVFALGGTTFGMAEESLAFYALVITVMIAAGYDALTGAAIVLLGCGIGVLGSTVNPFATGIASGIAGIPISEGLIGRLVILIVGLAIGIFFVLRYAERVKRDPSKSVVYELEAENEERFRSRRRPLQHGRLVPRRRREAGDGCPHRQPEVSLAARRDRRACPFDCDRNRREDYDHRGRRRGSARLRRAADRRLGLHGRAGRGVEGADRAPRPDQVNAETMAATGIRT
jgi:uncharacterized ion transporter superfamily protein YfcC